MKKVLVIIFSICLMVTFLPGCTSESAAPKNAISFMSLSEDQIELLSLLDTQTQNVLLFEYKTEEEYNSAEFWVEVYENGVLIDTPAKISYFENEGYKIDGKLAVTITNNENFRWQLTAMENGATYSHIGESSIINTLGWGSGSLNGAVEIEDGKEIVLHAAVFADGNFNTYSDQQIYLEEPELLNEYSYVHLIKCKFNKFIT